MAQAVERKAQWHLIGHLQRNKARKAARIFDVVQTVDSWRLARALERSCEALGKAIPVLVEVNSGRGANLVRIGSGIFGSRPEAG